MAQFSERDRHQFLARAVLSLILTIACLYVLLVRENPSDSLTKWAIATVGVVIGYWLR